MIGDYQTHLRLLHPTCKIIRKFFFLSSYKLCKGLYFELVAVKHSVSKSGEVQDIRDHPSSCPLTAVIHVERVPQLVVLVAEVVPATHNNEQFL